MAEPTPSTLLPDPPKPQRPRTLTAIALAVPVIALLAWLGLQPPPKPRNATLEAPATASAPPALLNTPRPKERPTEPFPTLAEADARRRLEEAALAQSLGIDPEAPYDEAALDPAPAYGPFAGRPANPYGVAPPPLGHTDPPPSPSSRPHPALVIRPAAAYASTLAPATRPGGAAFDDGSAALGAPPADPALAVLPQALNLLSPKPAPAKPQAYLSPTPDREAAITRPRATTRRLRAGTLISAILLTPINTTLEQTVVAQTTRDLWDSTLTRILLPAGTRLIGKTSTDVATTQKRALTAWHTAQLADGSSVSLAADPGADALGTAGLAGHLHRHFFSSLGNATLLAIVGAGAQLSQPRRDSSATSPAAVTPQETVAAANGNELAQLTTEILRRDLNRAPLLTVDAPLRFTILVTADTLVGASS